MRCAVAAVVARSSGLGVVTRITRSAVRMASRVSGAAMLGAVSMITMDSPAPTGSPKIPAAVVALPWGSRSSMEMARPASFNAATISVAQVVLPTPPLPLTNAMRVVILSYFHILLLSDASFLKEFHEGSQVGRSTFLKADWHCHTFIFSDNR